MVRELRGWANLSNVGRSRSRTGDLRSGVQGSNRGRLGCETAELAQSGDEAAPGSHTQRVPTMLSINNLINRVKV